MKILPNFSELGRIFGKDRHTIKNMFEGKEATIRKKKGSELDKYKNEIIDVLSKPGIKIKAAFWYFKNEKKLFEKEMMAAAKELDFERATELRNALFGLRSS